MKFRIAKVRYTKGITLIKFNNPKEKKKFITIEKNLDLKKHLYKGSTGTKYELIKTLYVLKDTNDFNLYVDIPESGNQDYIPFIVIYKKL